MRSEARKFLLQASGSVGSVAMIADIWASNEQEAIGLAQEASKSIAGRNYYRFDLWALPGGADNHLARWSVELVPTVMHTAITKKELAS